MHIIVRGGVRLPPHTEESYYDCFRPKTHRDTFWSLERACCFPLCFFHNALQPNAGLKACLKLLVNTQIRTEILSSESASIPQWSPVIPFSSHPTHCFFLSFTWDFGRFPTANKCCKHALFLLSSFLIPLYCRFPMKLKGLDMGLLHPQSMPHSHSCKITYPPVTQGCAVSCLLLNHFRSLCLPRLIGAASISLRQCLHY